MRNVRFASNNFILKFSFPTFQKHLSFLITNKSVKFDRYLLIRLKLFYWLVFTTEINNKQDQIEPKWIKQSSKLRVWYMTYNLWYQYSNLDEKTVFFLENNELLFTYIHLISDREIRLAQRTTKILHKIWSVLNLCNF